MSKGRAKKNSGREHRFPAGHGYDQGRRGNLDRLNLEELDQDVGQPVESYSPTIRPSRTTLKPSRIARPGRPI